MKRIYLPFIVIAVLSAACSGDSQGYGEGRLQPPPEKISGQIRLADQVASQANAQSVLFIIARKKVGPPLAVKRVVAPQFPLEYQLGPQDVMLPGAVFQGEVDLSVRLDRDGNAGPAQPGDLTGRYPKNVVIGSNNVDILIDQVIE